MKRFTPAMAMAVAAMAFGQPATTFAQNVQPQQHGQPMSDEAMHNNTGHDETMPMQNGRMHDNQMHDDPMHGDQMHHDQMHHDQMRGDMHDDMHGMGEHHGWHRHCWTEWRHHHRMRVCH